MGCQTSDVHHDDLHHKFEEQNDLTVPQGEPWPSVAVEPNKDGFHVVLPPPGGCVSVPQFSIKDSGQRQEFSSGMVRDVANDKTNVALVFDGPMLWRWAVHLTKGAIKYAKRNWMKAAGDEEYERFRESAARHFAQWYNGEQDEDHAAAVFFNINGAEYVKGRKK